MRRTNLDGLPRCWRQAADDAKVDEAHAPVAHHQQVAYDRRISLTAWTPCHHPSRASASDRIVRNRVDGCRVCSCRVYHETGQQRDGMTLTCVQVCVEAGAVDHASEPHVERAAADPRAITA